MLKLSHPKMIKSFFLVFFELCGLVSHTDLLFFVNFVWLIITFYYFSGSRMLNPRDRDFNFALDRKIPEIPKIGIGIDIWKSWKIPSAESQNPEDRDRTLKIPRDSRKSWVEYPDNPGIGILFSGLFFRDIPKLLVVIIIYYIINISQSSREMKLSDSLKKSSCFFGSYATSKNRKIRGLIRNLGLGIFFPAILHRTVSTPKSRRCGGNIHCCNCSKSLRIKKGLALTLSRPLRRKKRLSWFSDFLEVTKSLT